jgi:hypothetical protein
MKNPSMVFLRNSGGCEEPYEYQAIGFGRHFGICLASYLLLGGGDEIRSAVREAAGTLQNSGVLGRLIS